MTFAQQPVACEVAPRACVLPMSLIEARAAVFNPALCLDLNQTARRALYGVLAFLNIKRRHQSIFPRRDKLRAEALLGSDATLYRGLAMLAEKGYITRSQLRCEHNGKFYLSPIGLTEKALRMIGLWEVIHSSPPAKLRDGHIEEHRKKEQSLKNTAGQPEVGQNSIDKKSGLPTELVPLCDLGVKKSAICWLMRESGRHGVRLGDMVGSVWHRIRYLRGREVVAYLKSLLPRGLDFAWMCRHRRDQVDVAEADRAARDKLLSLDARFNGFRVLSENGSTLGTFCYSENGEHYVRSNRGATPVNLRFAKAWLDGKLHLTPSIEAVCC